MNVDNMHINKPETTEIGEPSKDLHEPLCVRIVIDKVINSVTL